MFVDVWGCLPDESTRETTCCALQAAGLQNAWQAWRLDLEWATGLGTFFKIWP